MISWRAVGLGVVISAGLAALVYPRLHGLVAENVVGKAGGECRALQAAVEAYYIDHEKQYPPDGRSWPSIDPFSHPPAPYRYATSPSGLFYIIWSVGPDRAATVTGIDEHGRLTGAPGDDLYVSNGISRSGGF